MKKGMFLGSLILMTGCLTVSALQAHAQGKEKAAIKKVIKQETSTYFHKNYDDWAKTWVHDSSDYVINAGASGYRVLSGWNTIAKKYKEEMNNMGAPSKEGMTNLNTRTDYHIYVDGDMASVSFKQGENPDIETRTLVKIDGKWKIQSLTYINKPSYDMQRTLNSMKVFAGKWVLDGKATMEPSNGTALNMLKFNLEVTSNGLKQYSRFVYSRKENSYAPPADIEYFIPDYSTNKVSYFIIEKNASGQTYTSTGEVTSDKPRSFTVTVMYPDKRDAIQSQYTVTMQNGKWHQESKRFDRNGKQISTSTVNLRRANSPLRDAHGSHLTSLKPRSN